MGKKTEKYTLSLIVLLVLTSFFVYRPTDSVKTTKPTDLQTSLRQVPGYQVSPNIPLDDGIFTFLELDDYIQTRYLKDGRPIDLYIGYYFTLDKVSAAHSPLVCFPGQGWTITTPDEGRLQVGKNTINYAETIASLEQSQQLVIYWYQAHETTVTQIYRNKLNALVNEVTGGEQEHAFVRVSVPFGESGLEEARNIGQDFISAFYPVFLNYVNTSAKFPE